jgi:hypothetical protein
MGAKKVLCLMLLLKGPKTEISLFGVVVVAVVAGNVRTQQKPPQT